MQHSVSSSEKLQRYTGIALLHVFPLLAILVGVQPQDVLMFAILWPIQLVGSTLALHRYFAHKSFRTSRAFQGFLALCAALAFGDPIGFTGKHRIHHKFSDRDNDVHTPNQGLWQCWIGSLVDFGYSEEEMLRHAKDLCRYPELVWLHKHKRVPGLILATVLFLIGGISMVGIGFALGVVLILHLGSAVNYFCHTTGKRRFDTADSSTNHWFVALLSMGEGWHNNHHYYQTSARAGFYWWEFDLMYYVICLFEKLGLIWNVRRPPKWVYDNARPSGYGSQSTV